MTETLKNPVHFSGKIELTINKDPIGIKTLDYALKNDLRDIGVQLSAKWEW